MILSSNKNNINIAYSNQKKYNSLSKEEKDKWIYNIYNYYNKSIPLISYSMEDIFYSFKILCHQQKYSIITDCDDYSVFEKYNLHNLINFIKNNNHVKNTINKKTEKFLNCDLIIVDEDYQQKYIDICTLSDFYQNKERIVCKVLRNHGYYVYNPAEDHEGPMSWKYYMQKDIRIMLNLSLDAIIVMPGWNDSPGVDVELFTATKLLKIPAYEYVDLLRIDVNDPTYPEFALHKIKHITWNREVINE